MYIPFSIRLQYINKGCFQYLLEGKNFFLLWNQTKSEPVTARPEQDW
jgi:hypothetical protein